jgi:DNA-binding transcriptional ArsR family regulator
MVKYPQQILDSVFSALSDPTRRAIIERLPHGEASVIELAEPFDMSLPAKSKHLRILEEVALIARKRKGRVHHLRLAARPMQAADWLDHYRHLWDDQLDSLAAYLDGDPTDE